MKLKDKQEFVSRPTHRAGERGRPLRRALVLAIKYSFNRHYPDIGTSHRHILVQALPEPYQMLSIYLLEHQARAGRRQAADGRPV
ncbi:unnamed protein product, partial [Brenthis ino]